MVKWYPNRQNLQPYISRLISGAFWLASGVATFSDFLFLAAEQVQVLRHLLRHGQALRIEALDLLNRGSGVLGEVEDIHPPLGQDDPHADGGVPEGVDCVVGFREPCLIPP